MSRTRPMRGRTARAAALEQNGASRTGGQAGGRARGRAGRHAKLAGATALAGVLALSGCSFKGVSSLPLPGGPDLGDDPRTFKIEFTNVLDLVPQSTVKINDVSVGQVEEIDLAGGEGGWRAVVTVAVRDDVDLPDNATATISQTSLLGEKFVELAKPQNEPPRGELGEGDLIPLARTTHGTEIEQVLSAMSLLLNGGGLQQVATISHELQAAMGGREATIKSVLDRVNTFAGTLDRNRGAITQALDSLDRLIGKLSDERETIRATIDETGPAIAVLEQNREDLTGMLVALDKLSGTTTHVIDQSKADLMANLKDLDKILQNLNKAGTALPNALETMITYPFPATFGNVVEGDYGNVNLTIDLDFESISRNLLGGTDLEGGSGGGQEMRKMLQVPNVSIMDRALGVLAPDAKGGGLSDLQDVPEQPEPTPSKTPTGKKTPGTGEGGEGGEKGENGQNGDDGKWWERLFGGDQNKPGALGGGQSGLRHLMTGGLS